MPRLTRFYLRTAILYLALALLITTALAVSRWITLPLFIQHLSPVFFHFFMVGWVTQMIFGIAFWMFPIITRESPRGNEMIPWITYFLLNAGLLLRAVSEPVNAFNNHALWDWLLAVSAVLQLTAGLLFVIAIWPRIKEKYHR